MGRERSSHGYFHLHFSPLRHFSPNPVTPSQSPLQSSSTCKSPPPPETRFHDPPLPSLASSADTLASAYPNASRRLCSYCIIFAGDSPRRAGSGGDARSAVSSHAKSPNQGKEPAGSQTMGYGATLASFPTPPKPLFCAGGRQPHTEPPPQQGSFSLLSFSRTRCHRARAAGLRED